MRINKLAKEELSIQNIGQSRFWMGITIGLLISVTLTLLFNYSREFFRLFSANHADLILLNREELFFYNYFYALISICLGLSVTISVWVTNYQHQRKNSRLYKQLVKTNSLLIFWFALMAIGRLGSNLPFILYSSEGYDNHLDLYQNFRILFILIPLVIFLQAWFNVRLVYQSGKWITLSLFICIIFPLLLSFLDYNHQKIDTFYYIQYKQDYALINKELINAKVKYGITFHSTTIETLKKWHSESSMEQVEKIKLAFLANRQVSMDTIILEKIIIQLAKKSATGMNHRNPMDNWFYVEPNQLIKQLEYYQPNDSEAFELIMVLKEQIALANLSRLRWDEYENYSRLEIRRANYGEYYIPNGILNQLNTVSDSLKNYGQYKILTTDLPPLTKTKNIYLD
jgi:hypothetical protein